MNFINKYGIRFALALAVCVVIQSVQGSWDWFDFAGRFVATAIVVAASYPAEAWLTRRRFSSR
jgi:hypothetical protein